VSLKRVRLPEPEIAVAHDEEEEGQTEAG
jgi:hypothetical protein